MNIRADELYKALADLGRLPKTLKVERTLIETDTITGKMDREKKATNHSLVRITLGDGAAVVDFDKLKGFAKKMDKSLLTLEIWRGLTVTHSNGSLALCDIHATPAGELGLDKLSGA